ncbi:spidroin-1-like [Penaeus indicus]|uniref:spidroin-1-like n=1 Tax=Penaeus indicus TaxID=29960 RepID=UPI00300C6E84
MMTSIKGSGHAAVVQSGSEKRRECGNECINRGGEGGGVVLGAAADTTVSADRSFIGGRSGTGSRGRVQSGRGSRNTGTESKADGKSGARRDEGMRETGSKGGGKAGIGGTGRGECGSKRLAWPKALTQAAT